MSSSHPECITSGISYAVDYSLQGPFNASTYQGNGIVKASHPQQNNGIYADNQKRCVDSSFGLKYIKPVLKHTKENCQQVGASEKVKEDSEKNQETIVATQAKTERCAKVEEKILPKVPANIFQKKKTVAFGRTTNLSQTVEGTDIRKHQLALVGRKGKSDHSKKMETTKAEKVGCCEDKIKELEDKIENLEKRDKEREEQFLKLSDVVKGLMLHFSKVESPFKKAKDSQNLVPTRHNTEVRNDRYRGKENIPPEVLSVLKENDNNFDNYRRPSQPRMVANENVETDYFGTDTAGKIRVIKRKMEEDPEFERCVDEIIMRFGGDSSLTEINQDTKKPLHRKSVRYLARDVRKDCQPDPPVLRTTRVTKQMTVEKVQHSPSRSGLYSYDTARYLARYGIIYGDDDDEDSCKNENEAYRCCASPSKSLYRPGESTVYYPPSKYRGPRTVGRRKEGVFKATQRRYKRCNNENAVEEEEDICSDSESLLNEPVEVDNIFDAFDDEGGDDSEYATNQRNRVLHRSLRTACNSNRIALR